MIQTVQRHNGRPSALAVCDLCGAEREAVCDYEMGAGGKWLANEGQVLRKVTAAGWTFVKHRLRCPGCSRARKEDVRKMTNVTELRAPTREQKRQIVELLGAVYDTGAERYKSGETDVTVADAIGNGCMFGWVAQIREEMFGPAGSNEEIDRLREDIEVLRARIDALTGELAKDRERIEAMAQRLASITKTVGPKRVAK